MKQSIEESYKQGYGLVSIITPTWNCGKFIAETIDCVLAQTYPNWEMLIIDDCSTDNTRAVVAKYSDPRIQYHCLEKNSGAAVARNTALKMAHGRWIAFLDSDDLWKPKKLEQQLAFMVNNNYSFSYHRYEEMAENGKSLNRIITGPNHISRISMLSYCWPGCLTVMYDRFIVGDIQIPNIKKNNDYAMWLMVSKTSSCYLLDECLASYRKRSGSISNHGYISLIKWHYKLFHQALKSNPIMSSVYTLNNLFWGVFKKLFYVSKS